MHEEPNKLLKRAVSEITYNINVNKLEPHNAVVKVAKDLDLNVHFIKRASEAINVALTHYHFKKHAEARDEDFPIVDFEKVSQEVFNTPVKTTNEKKSEWFSSVDVTDEIPNFNKLLANNKVKKAYADIIITEDAHTSFDMSQKGKLDKIALLQNKMEKELEDIATKKAGALYDLNQNFVKLANWFSRDSAYRGSFAEFEKQAYALYGERAVPYLDLIYKSAGITEARGEHDPKYTSFKTAHEAQMLGGLLKSGSDLAAVEQQHATRTLSYLNTVKNIKEAYHQMAETEPAIQIEEPAQVKSASNSEEPNLEDPVMTLVAQKIKVAAFEDKEANETFTEYQRSIIPRETQIDIIRQKQAGNEEPLNRVKKAFDFVNMALDKYKNESSPRVSVPSTSYQDNLERKLLLERMLVTDPILSQADPKRVTDAYEQFLHLAPELSKEPEVVKGALRAMTASQSLEPHTAQQFIEANTSFTNQKMQQQGVGKK